MQSCDTEVEGWAPFSLTGFDSEASFPVLISASVSVVQKDQLNLQSIEILSLRESLHVEQQRYRQLWDDRETMVTRLHSQIRQLQQGRDDYYTKNQELQVETHTYIHTMDYILKLGYVGLEYAEVLGKVQTCIQKQLNL